MPGLNLGTFGGTTRRPQPTTAPQPATSVTSAAFGPGYTAAAPDSKSALKPNDPFGVTFWVGIAAVVGLFLIRRSLPR